MSVDPVGLDGKRSAPIPTPHFVKATKFSLGGLRRLLQERAFREEVVSLVVIFALFIIAHAGPTAYLTQFVLFLILAAVEALNTAIEELVDRISPEMSRFAEQAKDLGSFAVFCLLAANGAHALLVVARLVL